MRPKMFLSLMVGMLAPEAVSNREYMISDGGPLRPLDMVDPKWKPVRRIHRRGYPRLVGPDYSDRQPVLKRGKRRTLALKLAQVVDWDDPRANLYGCHPCPKCGEVRDRAAFRRPHGLMIECAACDDKRPAR